MNCDLCKQEREDMHALPLPVKDPTFPSLAINKIYFICAGCARWLTKLLEDRA